MSNRLSFLKEKYNILDFSHLDGLDEDDLVLEASKLIPNAISYSFIRALDKKILCIVANHDTFIKTSYLTLNGFEAFVEADPTKNKSIVQWLITTFLRLLKADFSSAYNLIVEDLQMAKQYLQVFEENKRKARFSKLCSGSHLLKDIKDYSDINQYKDLGQLFDAVSPFTKKDDPKNILSMINKFVDSGQAEVPFYDRKYTVFIPYSRDASVLFSDFANWCTAKDGNGMFESYTKNHKRPDGSPSKLYIVIDNNLFDGLSNEIYQIHFETKQFKDRTNTVNIDLHKLFNNSEGITDYFYNELVVCARRNKNKNNLYFKILQELGFASAIFDIMETDIKNIRISDQNLIKLDGISRFKELEMLILSNCGINELPACICDIDTLTQIMVPNNRLKTLPENIGNLKNLVFLNIKDNTIEMIPESISYLDVDNGGSLFRISCDEDLGLINQIKRLLPNVIIN